MLFSVWEWGEWKKKPLLYFLRDRQERVYFHQISIHVWPSQQWSVAGRVTPFYSFWYISCTCISCMCANTGGSKSWKTSCVFACELSWEAKAQDTVLIQMGKGITFHSAKQSSNPEESPILVLLQASRNHWSLANNYFTSVYWPSLRSIYFTSLSWFSFCFYPILWDRILI